MKRTSILGASLAAIGLVAGAGAAQAHHVVIGVGGNTTAGSAPYTAATTTGGISFDTDWGVPMTCSSATAAGNIARGATVPGTIGSITGSTWTGCVAPTLFNTKFKVTQTGTWSINATGHPDANGVAPGTITGIAAQVRSVNNAGVETHACDFDVAGTVSITFDEDTQQLVVDDGASYPLAINNVTDCFGEVTSDDSANFAGTYNVSATGGAVTFVP